ncbi:hypothetical protein CERSUDRAFT_111670 [Gelatoporia subvermispora B]|uniref:F-box domain-containing protein n=1 Tax=Ceriporiopsis subvermispora (strain B) TaxID=914234 RepID=M2QVE9_CERS8|nr:hypothetical protein CERSUDRAFT_111670 [Gelatoporia subvermispora B]
MHHCFEIYDIYLHILRCLRNSYDERDLAALAAMAGTCRALSDPALDVLWEEPSSIVDLIKCLPEETWEIGVGEHNRPRIVINEPLIPSDWARFGYYASRVRRLVIFDNPPSNQLLCEGSTLSTLTDHCLTTPLLPHLQYLEIQCLWQSSWPHIRSFSGPELTAFHGMLDSLSKRGTMSVLSNLAHVSPNLTSVEISTRCRGFDTSLIAEALQDLRNLRRVALEMPPPRQYPVELFSWLASLRLLSYLRLHLVAAALIVDMESSSNMPFPKKPRSFMQSLATLDTLCLSTTTLKAAHDVLSSFPGIPSLRSLSVRLELKFFDDQLEDDEAMLRQLCRVITGTCSHKQMTELEIDTVDNVTTGRIAPSISIDAIAPLFEFHSLERVTLCLSVVLLDIADADLERVATAWPSLRILDIMSVRPRGHGPVQSSLTCEALVILAMHAPQLESLGITLDAQSITLDKLRQIEGAQVALECLRELTIVESQCGDPHAIANAIHIMCPNLTHLWTSDKSEAGKWADVRRLWGGVQPRKRVTLLREAERGEREVTTDA